MEQIIGSDKMIDNAFGLGLSGFFMLIVLLLVSFVVVKVIGMMSKITDKLDVMTDRITDSNKELSNQLIKTSIVQDNILSIMKETMIAVNNNTMRMTMLEGKIEINYEQLNTLAIKKEDELNKLIEINIKLESVLYKLQE